MATKPLWPNGRFGVPQITPYTYRDGHTLLELITSLRDHVVEQLHPSLQHAIDQLVADVQSEYDKAHDRYVDGVQEFQRIHDAFMSDVNASLIALNDAAVKDLVVDSTSQLGSALRDIFASNTALADHIATTDQQFADHRSSVASDLQDLSNSVDTRHNELTNTVHATIAATNTRVEQLEHQYPEHYGATGDGSGDDTHALQAWLDDGWTTMKNGSTYRTTSTLYLNGDHRTINGNGATLHIVGDGSYDSFAVRAQGDYAAIMNLVIDGSKGGKSRGGISVHGDHAHIVNNVVTNMTADRGLMGIHVVSVAGGNTIVGNTVANMLAPSDGVIGDGNGVSRGIYFHADGQTVTQETLIAANNVHTIDGVEGDGIQVIVTDVANNNNPFGPAHTTVHGNTVSDCSRRMIKVQASDVNVTANVLREHSTKVKQYPQPALYVLQSDRVTVQANDVHFRQHLSGIYVSGISPVNAQQMMIKDNIVRGPLNVNKPCITMARLEDSTVSNNTTFGGYRSIAMSSSHRSTVVGNTSHRLPSASDIPNSLAIFLTSNCTRCVMANNVDASNPSGSYSPFSNQSVDGQTVNNIRVSG